MHVPAASFIILSWLVFVAATVRASEASPVGQDTIRDRFTLLQRMAGTNDLAAQNSNLLLAVLPELMKTNAGVTDEPGFMNVMNQAAAEVGITNAPPSESESSYRMYTNLIRAFAVDAGLPIQIPAKLIFLPPSFLSFASVKSSGWNLAIGSWGGARALVTKSTSQGVGKTNCH